MQINLAQLVFPFLESDPAYREAVQREKAVVEVVARVAPALEGQMHEALDRLIEPAVASAVRQALDGVRSDIRRLTRALDAVRRPAVQDSDPADWWKRGYDDVDDDKDVPF